MKLFSKKKNSKYDDLIADIEKTKLALESAHSNFENASDPDLIDCYIYELNSEQKRYKFLLRQAKELEQQGSEVRRAVDFS